MNEITNVLNKTHSFFFFVYKRQSRGCFKIINEAISFVLEGLSVEIQPMLFRFIPKVWFTFQNGRLHIIFY